MTMSPESLCGLSEQHLIQVALSDSFALQVHPEVAAPLQRLSALATQAGFELAIASGFRDFARQAAIWNQKYLGKRPILDRNNQVLDRRLLSDEQALWAILHWSALPGASRHHWGTDFDVYAANTLPQGTSIRLEPWEYQRGHQREFYAWLLEAMPDCGFFLPYRQDLGGVAIEPWHISHRQSAACSDALTPAQLLTYIEAHHIEGIEHIRRHFDKIYHQYIINISR